MRFESRTPRSAADLADGDLAASSGLAAAGAPTADGELARNQTI